MGHKTTLGMAVLFTTFFAAAEAQAWGPFGSPAGNDSPSVASRLAEGLGPARVQQIRAIQRNLHSFLAGVRNEIQTVNADLRSLWSEGERSQEARHAAREQVQELRHAAKQARTEARTERQALLPGKRVGQKRVTAPQDQVTRPGRRAGQAHEAHEGNGRGPRAAAQGHGPNERPSAPAASAHPRPRAPHAHGNGAGGNGPNAQSRRGQGPNGPSILAAQARAASPRPMARRHVNDAR